MKEQLQTKNEKIQYLCKGKGRKEDKYELGHIELDDHGSTIKMIIRPLILSREMADGIQKRIILTLRSMGLKVQKEYKKVKNSKL